MIYIRKSILIFLFFLFVLFFLGCTSDKESNSFIKDFNDEKAIFLEEQIVQNKKNAKSIEENFILNLKNEQELTENFFNQIVMAKIKSEIPKARKDITSDINLMFQEEKILNTDLDYKEFEKLFFEDIRVFYFFDTDTGELEQIFVIEKLHGNNRIIKLNWYKGICYDFSIEDGGSL